MRHLSAPSFARSPLPRRCDRGRVVRCEEAYRRLPLHRCFPLVTCRIQTRSARSGASEEILVRAKVQVVVAGPATPPPPE